MGGLKLGKEAQAKFDEARAKPDKEGMLEKKGAKRKNWNERYFVLKDNYLFYCKNKNTNPQGIINLHGCTVSKIEGPTARPNSFSVLAPKSVSIDAKWTNRTYFMAAKDEKEMASWMEWVDGSGKKAVERAAQKKVEEKKVDEEKKKEDKEMEVTGKGSSDSDSEDDKPAPKKEEPKKEEPKKEDSDEEKKASSEEEKTKGRQEEKEEEEQI